METSPHPIDASLFAATPPRRHRQHCSSQMSEKKGDLAKKIMSGPVIAGANNIIQMYFFPSL
jgi:hypothetical protein